MWVYICTSSILQREASQRLLVDAGRYKLSGSVVELHEADPESRAIDSSDWRVGGEGETRRREERSQEPQRQPLLLLQEEAG